MTTIAPSKPSLGQRVDALDWQEVRAQLDARGFAVTDQILTAAECSELADLFDGGRPSRIRRTIAGRRNCVWPEKCVAAPSQSQAQRR